EESRRTYGGSVGGRLRNDAAARSYSESARRRAARVETDSGPGWGSSRYTAGVSPPKTTVNAPTGLTPARPRAGISAPFAFRSEESRRTYGGSVGGRLRNDAAARSYSESARRRAARVETDSGPGWGSSRYTAGVSPPKTTVNAPTGLTPARPRAGISAPFAY